VTVHSSTAQSPGPDGVGAAILNSSTPSSRPCVCSSASTPTQWVLAAYEQRLRTWAEWAHASKIAEGT